MKKSIESLIMMIMEDNQPNVKLKRKRRDISTNKEKYVDRYVLANEFIRSTMNTKLEI